MAYISCKNASLGYEGKAIVSGLNFEVNKGDYLCIVGENGSGHGDLFKGYDGRYYYVYHVHNSGTNVVPRKTRIVPLIVTKGEDGIYSVTADKDNVIVPTWE